MYIARQAQHDGLHDRVVARVDGLDHEQARAPASRTPSPTMIEPFSSATNSERGEGHHRQRGVLEGVLPDHLPLGQPLDARQLDVLGAEHVEHDERVSRMSPATANQPSVMPGRITCSGVPRPEVGSRRSITPKTSTSSSPSQNGGTAWPSAAKARAA